EPAATGRLRLGDDDGPLRGAVAGELGREPVRRVDEVAMDDAELEPGGVVDVPEDLARQEPVRRPPEPVAAADDGLDLVAGPAQTVDPLPHRRSRDPELGREPGARDPLAA